MVDSSDGIEGKREQSYHFLYKSKIEGSRMVLKILLFFSFGSFKCNKDGGLKHPSFCAIRGCEMR